VFVTVNHSRTRQGSSLAPKCKARVEGTASHRNSSLLMHGINYGCKIFYSTGPLFDRNAIISSMQRNKINKCFGWLTNLLVIFGANGGSGKTIFYCLN